MNKTDQFRFGAHFPGDGPVPALVWAWVFKLWQRVCPASGRSVSLMRAGDLVYLAACG